MLSRTVRIRLVIFAVISALILTVMSIFYVRLPQLFGYDQYDVTADFSDATGLYENAIVTYRGAQVGRVGAITLRPDGVSVVLHLENGTQVPADSMASIHSTSAVGEQYVELVPTRNSGPDLRDGSAIDRAHTRILGRSSEMLDDLDQLLRSVPKKALARTVNDLDVGFHGTGPDLQRLLDSSSQLLDSAHANFGPTKALLSDLGPFLSTQRDLASETTSTVRNLASFTHQLVLSNSDIVSLLHELPPAATQLVKLEQDLTPTLNTLLADLTSTGKVVRVYVPAVKQLLTIYPALVATLVGFAQPTALTGFIPLYFHLNFNDPPPCTDGFLPVSKRRDPTDTSEASTPSGLYCRAPASAPESVRGARNTPCLNNPGVRAATPAACLGLPEPVAGSSTATAVTSRSGKKIFTPGATFSLVDAPEQKGPTRWQDLLLQTIGR